MDFLGKAYQQVIDIFRSMTPAARLTTGLLLVMVGISVVYLFRQQTDSAGEYLFDGEVFTGREIARMEAAFASAKLDDWDSKGNRIRVPRGQRSRYIAALAESGALPEHSGTRWEKFFEKDSPLDSRQQREIRARHTREQELEIAVRKINGIEGATVQITEIDKGGFPRNKERWAVITAAASSNQHLNSDQVRAIRYLVAHGGGVEAEHVTVIDSVASLSYPGTGKDGSPLTEEDAYAARQRQYEEYYKRLIEDRLTMYTGAKVAVYVELDRNLLNRTTSEKYDAQAVSLQTTNYTKTSNSSTPQNGGRPGAASNAVLGNTPQQVNTLDSAETSSDESHEETNSVPSVVHTTTEEAGLVPKRVTASIGIPRSLFLRVWKTENPPADGDSPRQPDKTELLEVEKQIIQDIEDSVVALLPQVPPGEDPFPLVTVKPYTEAPLPLPQGPTTAETAVSWLGSNWQTMGLFVVALCSMFFLRGMIRSAQSTPDNTPSASLPTESLVGIAAEDEDAEEEESDLANSLKARFQSTGRSLRDELTELVREDPDAAANVLSNWIGDAA